MKEVKIEISVFYREDGKVDRSKVQEAVVEYLLKTNRKELFANNATWAGYRVSLRSSVDRANAS